MNRVVFLNRFYWPDEPATAQLLGDLASRLAADGFDVSIIASQPDRADIPRCEQHEGVTIHRVRTTHWGRRNIFGRCIDFLSYLVGTTWRLWRIVRRGDAVVAMTDPPLLGLVTCPIVKLRGVRLIHWVQDIYPEIAIQLGRQGWMRMLRPWRDLSWRLADHCVVPGHDMALTLQASRTPLSKLTVLPNWAPAGLQSLSETSPHLRERWTLKGKFIAMYSGNLGRVHDLHPLLDVAEHLRRDANFVMLFVGDGAQRPALEAAVAARGLTNVQFHPPQPRNMLSATLAVADLHFVTLLPGAERWVFPSKLYGIAKVGRPIIFVGAEQCELAKIVTEQNFGRAFHRDSSMAIATFIRELQSQPKDRLAMQSAALQFERTGLEEAVRIWTGLLSAKLAAPTKVTAQ